MDDRDRNIQEQAERAYDALTPDQQRATFVRQHVLLHNLHMAVYYFMEGESDFKKPKDLVAWLNRMLWAAFTPPPSTEPPGVRLTSREKAEVQNLVELDDIADRRRESSELPDATPTA